MAAHLSQIHREELERNRIQNLGHAFVILGAMVLLLASIGWYLGGPGGVLILLALGSALAFFNPRVSGSLILRLQGSVPLNRSMAPGLYQVLDVLTERAGLPVRPPDLLDAGAEPRRRDALALGRL